MTSSLSSNAKVTLILFLIDFALSIQELVHLHQAFLGGLHSKQEQFSLSSILNDIALFDSGREPPKQDYTDSSSVILMLASSYPNLGTGSPS